MRFEDKREGGGSYLKLGDGEKVKGIFRGDPYTFKIHWADNKSSLCEGADCDLCMRGDKPKFRFKVNVIVKDKESGEYAAKVFEQSYQTYDAMRSLHMELAEQGMGLDRVVVNIGRTGQKKDTKYTIIPVMGPAGQVTPELEKIIQLIKLNPIRPGEADEEEEERVPATAMENLGEDDIPF